MDDEVPEIEPFTLDVYEGQTMEENEPTIAVSAITENERQRGWVYSRLLGGLTLTTRSIAGAETYARKKTNMKHN